MKNSNNKKNKKVSNNPKTQTIHKNNKVGLLPLGDRVIIRPLSAEELDERTISGIIIPDTVSKEKPEQGEVVAVGDGKWIDGAKVPLTLKIGDRVIFSKYGYDEVKYKGEEFYVLKEDSILAIIN